MSHMSIGFMDFPKPVNKTSAMSFGGYNGSRTFQLLPMTLNGYMLRLEEVSTLSMEFRIRR